MSNSKSERIICVALIFRESFQAISSCKSMKPSYFENEIFSTSVRAIKSSVLYIGSHLELSVAKLKVLRCCSCSRNCKLDYS